MSVECPDHNRILIQFERYNKTKHMRRENSKMKKIKELVIRFMNYMEDTLNEVTKYDPTFSFTNPRLA